MKYLYDMQKWNLLNTPTSCMAPLFSVGMLTGSRHGPWNRLVVYISENTKVQAGAIGFRQIIHTT